MAGCMLLDHQWWLRSGESLSPDAKSVRSREAGPPGEIPSMPLPTVDKEFLPSDLLKLPRSPNVDGPKKTLCWARCFRDSPFRRLAAEWVEQDQRAWPVVAEPQSAVSSSVKTAGPAWLVSTPNVFAFKTSVRSVILLRLLARLN